MGICSSVFVIDMLNNRSERLKRPLSTLGNENQGRRASWSRLKRSCLSRSAQNAISQAARLDAYGALCLLAHSCRSLNSFFAAEIAATRSSSSKFSTDGMSFAILLARLSSAQFE